MKKLLFLITCSVFYITSYSQQTVIATSGDYFRNGSTSISFTIGDLMIDSYLGSNSSITQGFQQTQVLSTEIENVTKVGLNISIYPNPTTDIVNIKFEGDNLDNISYVLYDIKGQKLIQEPIIKGQSKLSLLQYLPSIYLLKIVKGTTTIHTFKLVKH